MIKVLFICHGSTVGILELAVLVEQNGAKCGIEDGGVLRVRSLKLKVLK